MHSHSLKKDVMVNHKKNVFPNQLVEKIQQGDKSAFAEIYKAHFYGLCDFSYRYIKSQAVCEELVQDLFLYIWQNRREWNPSGTVKSYLYKSIKNRSLDYLKHKRVQNEFANQQREEVEYTTVTQDNLRLHKSEDQLIKSIHLAIESLPDQRKMIFKMSREDGLTYREIAEVLEISVKTVETQMGRSLKTLREHLSKYIPGLAFLYSHFQNLI